MIKNVDGIGIQMDLIRWTQNQKKAKKFTVKKLGIFLFSIFIWILILYSLYFYDSIKQTKKNMEKVALYLCDYIKEDKKDIAMKLVVKEDGTALSEEEYNNFLVNSGLYKIKFMQEYKQENISFYNPKVNWINRKSGEIGMSFTTISGEKFAINLKYQKDGIYEHFIVEDYKTPEKEWIEVSVPFDTDLLGEAFSGNGYLYANGSIDGVYDMYVEDGVLHLSYIEEVREDMLCVMESILPYCEHSLKAKNSDYYIEVNEEKNEFNIYYDSSVAESMTGETVRMGLFEYAVLCQVLSGNENWQFELYAYDYESGELLEHYLNK